MSRLVTRTRGITLEDTAWMRVENLARKAHLSESFVLSRAVLWGLRVLESYSSQERDLGPLQTATDHFLWGEAPQRTDEGGDEDK